MPSNTKYSLLQPAKFRLDGGAMFGIIPRPLWNKVAPSDSQNRIDLALRLWVIESGEKVILVDTGIGDYHGKKFEERFDVRGKPSPLKLALNEIGLNPADITDLIISHLHFDHVGGIGEMIDDEMVPVFENANLHLHKSHYEYSLSPTERDGGSFHVKNYLPIIESYENKSKVIWHEDEEGEFFNLEDGNSLRYKCSFGHTPWLMHPYDNKMIYLADLIPTSNHVHIPWVMGYDINPGVTTKYKREFLKFIVEKDLILIYEHDPLFWGSKIVPHEKKSFEANSRFEAKDDIGHHLVNV